MTTNIVKPKVRLIAKTVIVDPQLEKEIENEEGNCYVGAVEDGEALVEFAGRGCYESFQNPSGRTNQEYIENLKNQRHYSVLEHTHVTFHISGVSRGFTHQLIRHRHFNYSQLSTRYVDQSKLGMVCPPLVRDDPALYSEWLVSIGKAQAELAFFQNTIKNRYPDIPKKRIQEAVRTVAPHAMESRIVVTGNLRSWKEMLDKRLSDAADAEFQEVARLLETQLKLIYPYVFNGKEA